MIDYKRLTVLNRLDAYENYLKNLPMTGNC